jgi:endonuclease III
VAHTQHRRLQRLLTRHGRTTADELGIDLRRGGADARFQLLVAALLLSARISSELAIGAARVLSAAGFTSARAMCDATWQQRVDCLGEGGYVRYDESTARYLGATSELLLDQYDGDLDQLRDAADRDPGRERERLREFTGIGEVGADILCRELQAIWDELRPFVDQRSLATARDLSLPTDAAGLARLHGDDDLAVVAAALVRVQLEDDLEVVRDGRDAPPTDTQLQRASKDELLDLARDAGIEDRSKLRKDELVDALRDRR